MSVVVAVTRTACSIAGGSQDITTADLGGLTPKAARLTLSYATADGVAAAHDVTSLGVTTGAYEEWQINSQNENNVASVDSGAHANLGQCIYALNPTNVATVIAAAETTAFIVNGVRINWKTTPVAAYLLTVVFFAGTDLSAKAGTFILDGTSGNTVDVNTVGFEPDVLMTAGAYRLFTGPEGTTELKNAYGIVLNTDPVRQYCLARSSENGAAAGDPSSMISDDYGIFWVNSAGAKVLAGEFGSFDASGFSCTTRVASVADKACGYLALAFDGKVRFEAGTIDTPVVTGNQVVTAPGFKPQFVYGLLSDCETLETGYADGRGGSTGITVFDADEAYCNSNQDGHGADPTNTQSLSDDACVALPQDDGVGGHAASFVSFDATGWTWNFSATINPSKKWIYLAIEVPYRVWVVASASDRWWYRRVS